MNKKTLFLILLAIISMPLASVSAVNTLGGMAQAIAGQVIIVGTWIVVIMWVVTGILFLTALGDPSKLNSAKMALFAAIGGTIIILLANGACSFINNSFQVGGSC